MEICSHSKFRAGYMSLAAFQKVFAYLDLQTPLRWLVSDPEGRRGTGARILQDEL